MNDILRIGERQYHKGPSGVFEIPLSELGDLYFTAVPYYSTLEVRDLPGSKESYMLDITATHSGGPSNDFFVLNFHVGFWQPGNWNNPTSVESTDRRLRHMQHVLRDAAEKLQLDDGEGERSQSVFHGRFLCSVLYSRTFDRVEDPCLASFVEVFVEYFCDLLISPEGWQKVEHQLREAQARLDAAGTEEQYQAVGLLCREVLISAAQAVYDPSLHSSGDDVKPSDTDAKRMIEAFLNSAYKGSANKEVRDHAKTALGLALKLQHQRTAGLRIARLCVEATRSVVGVLAILSGRTG
ncbi:MAG: hypothetical protein ACE5Q6_08735 [Dehalococcoidia bacterium]